MTKASLLEKIQVSHRQLLRYIFFFEKDKRGHFTATDRPKFNPDEMLQPGVVGDWSLKDLLADLLHWEKRLIHWIDTTQDGYPPPDDPPVISAWYDMTIDKLERPHLAKICSLREILSETRIQYRDVMKAVERIPEEKLFVEGEFPWMGEKSAADLVALCTFDHYDWAKRLIRKWRRTHAGEYLNKKVVLERILVESRRLDNNLDSLSSHQKLLAGVVGKWSVKDLLAHLADWEQRFIGWYQAGLRGEYLQIPAPGISWDDLDVLNRRIFEAHKDRSLKDIMNWYNSSYRQLLEIVRAIPEEDMFAPGRYPWLGESNLVSYILANSANHYRWANQQIRKWRKLQAIKD